MLRDPREVSLMGRRMKQGLVIASALLLLSSGSASAMGDKELARAMAKRSGLSVEQAEAALAAFKSVVVTQVKSGDAVRLKGFGKFTMQERKAHTGRNPRTGEKMTIPARNVLRFKPFQAVKEQLNPKQ
ncbi:MAG: HU family DNA-binding protein [Zetaproteobacteria bacterium]|nr:MAG: HU family DNA-binding protein [Zetaproteobacteria bacterium]